MENGELVPKPQKERTRGDALSDLIGGLVVALTPHDRPPPEEKRPQGFKMPGPGILKDLIGGPIGILKGVALDNSKQILGAQPVSSGENPYPPLRFIEDAGAGIVSREVHGRINLADILLLEEAEKKRVLRDIQRNTAARRAIASTPEGQQFLNAAGIKLTPADKLAAASIALGRAIAPKRNGTTVGINNPIATAAGAVVDAITALERFTAANPADP